MAEYSDTPRTRKNIFLCYSELMTAYLKSVRPDVPEQKIVAWVNDHIRAKIKELKENLMRDKHNGVDLDEPIIGGKVTRWPTVRIVRQCMEDDPYHRRSYGNLTPYDHEDLFVVMNEYKNKILSPAGTFYETSDKCKPFLVEMDEFKKNRRSKEKKLMLKAYAEGNVVAGNYHFNAQTTIKVGRNAISGGMNTKTCFINSKANYNSITSIARFGIQHSYGHAERFLESNFFFGSEEQVFNFIATCQVLGPSAADTLAMVTKYNLKVPTTEDVLKFLIDALHRNTPFEDHPKLEEYIKTLDTGTRCWIYYMSNGVHLIQENEEVFRSWIDNFFVPVEQVTFDDSIDPNDLKKVDNDLLIIVATVYNDLLPRDPKSHNSIPALATLDPKYNRPDVAKKLVVLSRLMQDKLDKIKDLFDFFTKHNVGIGYVSQHKNMFRDTTILSDTDSIIFTTEHWAQWYNHGSLKLDHRAYCLNALVVYWLSKANANILAHLGKIIGACGPNATLLEMKNEYMMPVAILTSRKKHYISSMFIQEGVYYANPKLDIKGVGLRGSNLCAPTLNYTKWFIRTLVDDISTNEDKISAVKYIREVLRFERMIYDDIRAGNTTYLPVEPIREANEYKDASKSIFFNYEFWEEIFAADYGNIQLPSKCYILPLTGVSSYSYIAWLQRIKPNIATKLSGFLKQNALKTVTRVPINPLVNKIPDELQPVTAVEQVVFTNSQPLYLVLNSLGLGTGTDSKKRILFSRIYGWVTSEEGAVAATHVN